MLGGCGNYKPTCIIRMNDKKRRRRRFLGEPLERRMLLAADLIAHWLADDLTDQLADGQALSTWQDAVADLPASSVGTPSYTANRFGGRATVLFDNVEARDALTVASRHSPISGRTDFSITVAFASTNTDLPDDPIDWHAGIGMVHSNRLGFSLDWGISLHTEGTVAAGVGSGMNQPTASLFSSQSNLNDGQLHYATFAKQGDQISLKVDHGEIVTQADANPDARRQLDMNFGNPSVLGDAFYGELAQVRFYDGALDAAQMEDLHEELRIYYSNVAPSPQPDHYTVTEDQMTIISATGGLLANDTDADGDKISAKLVEPSQHGALTIRDDGGFVYIPETNFFGTDTFRYVAVDTRPSAPVTVTFDVTGVYDGVTPHPDSYRALPESSYTVLTLDGVLTNDINIDRLPLSAVLEQPLDDATGELALHPDGSFVYTPHGFVGKTQFQYLVDDTVERSDPVTVTIHVNTPPKANPDSYEVEEDAILDINPAHGVGANDLDQDSHRLIYRLEQPTAHGQLTFAGNGGLRYHPNPDYFGQDQFTYVVEDEMGDTDVGTVNISVLAQNDAPVVMDDSYYLPRNTELVVEASNGLLQNDWDVDSSKLTVTLQNEPQHGKIQAAADGTFTYRPASDFVGQDTFTYQVQDSRGATSTGKVILSIGTTPLVMSELMAANYQTITTQVRSDPGAPLDEDLLTPDWIEIENRSSIDFDVSGFFLSDDPDEPKKWEFPTGSIVPGEGHLVVFASRLDLKNPLLDAHGNLHTNFKIGHDNGESILLSQPDGTLATGLPQMLPEQTPDVSYGISVNGQLAYLSAPTAGRPNAPALAGVLSPVEFSHPRGFYDQAVNVTLTAQNGAQIYYTLDGSPPSTDARPYSEPITIETTSNLRAAAFQDGYVSSRPITHTYLFIDDILTQPTNPIGLPTNWGTTGRGDYQMDPDVVVDTESPFYDANVADALRALPTISITTEVDGMFGKEQGLHAFPRAKGDSWERPTSVELIDFDTFADLQLDAGIRMVGNASRSPNRFKHNFRLAFRDDYAFSELTAPLFDLGSDETHDNLILRGGNGDSWVNPGTRRRAQYIRDQWQRDLQVEMGHLTTHQIYSHLYINGLYWGLYHVFERHDAAFMARHLGGEEEAYDAIKDVNGQTAAVETVSGSIDGWETLIDTIADRDLSADEKFEVVSAAVDVDNMIDYLLINFYAGNGDWDHNNFRTGRHVDGKFMFFTWDAERADINRTNDSSMGPLRVTDSQIGTNAVITNRAGRPTQIHYRLRDSLEYQIRFADRVQRHLFNGGVLTPEVASRLWNTRADEIRLPMSAESARWGDLHSARRPQTVDDWEEVLQIMNERFFPVRTNIVLDQLERSRFDLVRTIPAPTLSQHGGAITPGFQLSMTGSGTIYYTLDGTDPRVTGGATSLTATAYEQPLSLTDGVTLKARLRQSDGQWSPLTEATFVPVSQPANASNFRITEIHFNPSEPSSQERAAGFGNNNDFEFLEFVNISDQWIDLKGVRLENRQGEGVIFDFSQAETTLLAPGEPVLVVENLAAFELRYGTDLPVAGEWSGRLGNGGERLYLTAENEILHQFSYDDEWHPSTDGQGPSLEIIDAAVADLQFWEMPGSWRPSPFSGGSPGHSVKHALPGDANGDGVFDEADLIRVFEIGEYDDGIDNNSTHSDGDWNGDGDFDSEDLVYAFTQGVYVFDDRQD